MRPRPLPLSAIAATLTLGMALSACSSGGGSQSTADAAKAHGDIKIWYSNNPQEVAWGKAAVAAWNSAHPKEKVSAEEVPAGKSSEEVIGAAITAGTEPCLIFNTAPAAVSGFQQQGGLVSLSDFPDGNAYIESRTGARAQQYRSADGKFYQLPWKSNPVMIFYNKKLLAKAGVDAAHPPLATYDQFLATARKLVSSKAAKYAIQPAPTSEFYQSWFDFYPLYVAESGRQLVENGKSTFTSAQGQSVARFWRTLYQEGLSGKETYTGDAFGDGKSAMAVVGPWAVANYQGKVDWGVAPVPTSSGTAGHTFSDAKNAAMYASCRNRGTAWDFLKFATGKDQDGALLKATGQMPMRVGLTAAYPDFFAADPAFKAFAEQAETTVEVPNVANSVEIWQKFRDAWSKSVIFGKEDPATSFGDVAQQIDTLAKH